MRRKGSDNVDKDNNVTIHPRKGHDSPHTHARLKGVQMLTSTSRGRSGGPQTVSIPRGSIGPKGTRYRAMENSIGDG
jgi:hypothetical protein